MFYSIFIIDKEGSGAQRVPAVEAHRQYIKDRAHKILAAGATFADDGKTVRGGSYIVEMDKDEVERFVAEDPFTLAGIREKVIVQPWIKACFNGEFLITVTPPGPPDVNERLIEPERKSA
ncbi:YciI family protein [Rhodoligotrophos defluvii]|uniref:YciI family protein n=1 Tax=Rhodoligotrophos defluvii TaxID=2561934 RepID=UPI0010C992D7|nr:YciI family protein [Rhodoligotrophos defluvii]